MRRIPEPTIRRMPAYLRVLEHCEEERITSGALGRLTGFSSEQVRKDLAYFGAFGTRGVGYEVRALAGEIRRILGLDRGVRALVVGAGHLGTALARFIQSSPSDVKLAAVLDRDPKVVGSMIGSMTVEDIADLERIVHSRQVHMAVLTVPREAAPVMADRLAQAGVAAILNFAPVTILADRPEVSVQNIDLTLEMQALAYFVAEKKTVIPIDPQKAAASEGGTQWEDEPDRENPA